MNAQHTPGPWTVRAGVCQNDHPDTSADVHGRDGQFVANCGCHEEATPNARLIAAAPELLEALKQVQDWLLETGQLEDDGITHPLMLRANNLAVAAIAKAEGTHA